MPSPVAHRDEDDAATAKLDAATVAAIQRATDAAERAAAAAERAEAALTNARATTGGVDAAALQRTADAAQQAAAAAERAASRATEAADAARAASEAAAAASAERAERDNNAAQTRTRITSTSRALGPLETLWDGDEDQDNVTSVRFDAPQQRTDSSTASATSLVPLTTPEKRPEWTHHADGTFTHAALAVGADVRGSPQKSPSRSKAFKPKRFLGSSR
jgi:hypothetical protein